MGMEVSSWRKNQKVQAPIKLAQPFLAPELWAENFTDMVSFLINMPDKMPPRVYACQFCASPGDEAHALLQGIIANGHVLLLCLIQLTRDRGLWPTMGAKIVRVFQTCLS